MNIKKIVNSYFQTNTYILEYKDKIFIIDPGSNIGDILLNYEKVDYILLTHGHMDHIVGVKDLIKKYDPLVYASKDDINYINGNIILDKYLNKDTYNFNFIDYDDFDFEGINIIKTPGHSLGSICIHLVNEKIIFSGDTMFLGTFGRYDFKEGDFNLLKKSLKLLLSMDENIEIYPGHGENTRIKEEKIINMINFY